MTDLPLISRYFPDLSTTQQEQLAQLPALYRDWNSKINVISRKDIDEIEEHHLLHSLAIARFVSFVPGTRIYDIGTGGGFPGIPLAIRFPEVHFTLVDSIGKKVRVAQAIADAIQLHNVTTLQERGEKLQSTCHYVVSRAAMPADALVKIARRIVASDEQLNALPNGVIMLKGGDLTQELSPFRQICSTEEIIHYFPDNPYFDSKKVIHIPL